MEEQIGRIINKLQILKELDKTFQVFGADCHQYKFNPCKSEEELISFERENKITLPLGYRMFLKEIGNGGAGPYYGLEPLENGREVDLDHIDGKDLLDLSKPFRYSDHWNIDFDALGEITDDNYEEIETFLIENYYDNKYVDGLLRICNFGCGVRINLVVNGSEKGKVWIDDRVNNNGLFFDCYFGNEDKLEFLDWYELWLDQSIAEQNCD